MESSRDQEAGASVPAGEPRASNAMTPVSDLQGSGVQPETGAPEPKLSSDLPSSSGTAAGTQASSASPTGPVREDQVRNAVTFLSHPKVRESSTATKRSFLERKGLTAAEIDEAFRRVPESSSGSSDGGYPSSSTGYSPGSTQAALPPVAATPPAKPYQQQQGMALTPHQPQLPGQAMVVAPPQSQGIRWTQVVISASLVAAGAYAVHSLLWPRAMELYERWTGPAREAQRRREEEAATNAKMVADALEAQAQELRSTVDSLKQLISSVEAQQRSSSSRPSTPEPSAAAMAMEGLREELRVVTMNLREIKSQPLPQQPAPSPALERELRDIKSLLLSSSQQQQPLSRSSSLGKTAAGVTRWPDPLGGGGGVGTSADYVPSIAVATGANSSYVERFPVAPASRTGVHRGTPSPTAAAAAEAAAQSEFAAARVASGSYSSDRVVVPGGSGQPPAPIPAITTSLVVNSTSGAAPASTDAAGTAAPEQPPHPASYVEVLEMLEKGQTPPGIRDDINDAPPDPLQPPSEGRLRPRAKPWERADSAGAAGSGSALGSSAPGSAASVVQGGLPSDGTSPLPQQQPYQSPAPPSVSSPSPSKMLQSNGTNRSMSLLRGSAGTPDEAAAGAGGFRRGFTYGEVMSHHNGGPGGSNAAQVVMTSLGSTELPGANGGTLSPAAAPTTGVSNGRVSSPPVVWPSASSAPTSPWRPPALPQPTVQLPRARSSSSISSAA